MKQQQFTDEQLRYLNLLSNNFPTIQSACTEIINLEAILNLPKGTEHFLTDIHGEFDMFSHILRNASGMVRKKIDDVFGSTISEKSKRLLATLIYYPEQKLEIVMKSVDDLNNWYAVTLRRLIEVARAAADKYTRSKVRKAMPKDYAYIIDELLNENHTNKKEQYYDQIIQSIIDINRANHFIIAISYFIQRLLIDKLHIVGDIFDRGPYPDKVMEKLMEFHDVDIQWGNHDILWMGAASGIMACIACVVRIATRYDNLDTLEDAYGINMLPLATFAMKTYNDDPCKEFTPKVNGDDYDSSNLQLIAMMHKAISIIQFKLEGKIIRENKEFKMESRLLLDKINFDNGTIMIGGKEYKMLDMNLPTIDKADPYKLSPEEEDLMEKLKFSFLNSQSLQRHVKFLFSSGSFYLKCNSNILFHGCIPLNEDGSFRQVNLDGKVFSGKSLCDKFESMVRAAYINRWAKEGYEKEKAYFWYLWCGPDSPLFGKDQMTTFERYFIADKATHKENLDPFYKNRDNKDVCVNILKEFDLNPENSHIVTGHVPVKVIKGESPIKAGGMLLVIDGGMSKPYQKETGIAGYTLMYDSYRITVIEHHPFVSPQKAIEEELDIASTRSLVTQSAERIKVGDTDKGIEIKKQISDLKLLLQAYMSGEVKVKA